MAAAAMPAIAADVAVGRGGHEIAALRSSTSEPSLLDRAGHLVTEDDRHADAAPIGAVAHHDIMKADAAGGDRDPDLARTRLARRHIGDAQDVGRTGSLGDDGTHRGPRLSSPRASPR